MITQRLSLRGLAGLSLVLAALAPASAAADQNDPPARVARLAYVQGSVAFQPGGTAEWVAPPVNRPLTTGDRLWSDRNGRAELQLGGSFLRLGSNTAVSFLNVGDRVTQIQLSAGTLVVRVRRLDGDETYEIDTPNLAFSVLRPGLYRLSVDEAGNTTSIAVRSGQGEVTGGGVAYSLRANDYEEFSGTDRLVENRPEYGPSEDSFDSWSANRDNRWERSASSRYVSSDIVGSEDLDDHGSWRPTPEYGHVWFPRGVPVDWAPYHDGHWAYIAPWGYTWVDDSPWGYAPFHYGRWVSVEGAWGWVPAPPRRAGMVYVRPVYAPALVAWIGVGAGVAWFALGPREVYVPSYPVSRGYVNSINVSNTTVNTTVVNNVYNTTIVNNNVNVSNVTYVNRAVPGAVVGTTSQAFASAQPVARNIVRVDERAAAAAAVRPFAPAAALTAQAVLGPGQATAIKPPAAVQTRVVVARTAPPPPPPAFERRQEAIRSNEGRPLSVAQVRQIQTDAAPQPAAVRIAPPATPVASASRAVASADRAGAAPVRPAEAQPPATHTSPGSAPSGADRPPAHPPFAIAEAPRPAHPAVHPSEAPAVPGPPSTTGANSLLEQQHLQDQQQLHARQEERQHVLQQQQLEQHQEQARQEQNQPPPRSRGADRPPIPSVEAARPTPAPIHPNEIPVAPRPPSPNSANSVLERQHLQEQLQLHAQQAAERQRVQQQHDLEHAQLAQQQADAAHRQQIEAQHQQQTQLLMQKHAQEQQLLLDRHQEQQRQQGSQPPTKGRGTDRPPGEKS